MDALVAFMEALTDSTFLRDARFSDPFPCGSLAGRTPPGSPPPATSAP
jgi:hypothetical protein